MNRNDAINCIQDIIDVANSHGSACVYSRNGGVAQMENVLVCLKKSEPVKHGHWMSLGEKRGDPSYHSHMHEYWCSACDICIGGEISHYEYCPHCGAKMDEDEEDAGDLH